MLTRVKRIVNIVLVNSGTTSSSGSGSEIDGGCGGHCSDTVTTTTVSITFQNVSLKQA